MKGTHLPMSIKEIQAGYLTGSYFKNIYSFLVQNSLPSSKVAVRQVESQAERYLLLTSLLFRIQHFHDEQKPVLCIPESCVGYILDIYCKSLFGVHLGCLRTFFNNQAKVLYTKFNAPY